MYLDSFITVKFSITKRMFSQQSAKMQRNPQSFFEFGTNTLAIDNETRGCVNDPVHLKRCHPARRDTMEQSYLIPKLMRLRENKSS